MLADSWKDELTTTKQQKIVDLLCYKASAIGHCQRQPVAFLHSVDNVLSRIRCFFETYRLAGLSSLSEIFVFCNGMTLNVHFCHVKASDTFKIGLFITCANVRRKHHLIEFI